MEEEKVKLSAVYTSWTTFKNALKSLAQASRPRSTRASFPDSRAVVRRSSWRPWKFLDLITDDGTPKPALNAVAVLDEEAQKTALKKILAQLLTHSRSTSRR